MWKEPLDFSYVDPLSGLKWPFCRGQPGTRLLSTDRVSLACGHEWSWDEVTLVEESQYPQGRKKGP